jgi:hypothetical protein
LRQIIVGKKIERNLLSHDPKHELSTRVRNALSDDGCELIPDAVANHFKSLGQLRRVPNLGKKSIDELQVWLQRHGKKTDMRIRVRGPAKTYGGPMGYGRLARARTVPRMSQRLRSLV